MMALMGLSSVGEWNGIPHSLLRQAWPTSMPSSVLKSYPLTSILTRIIYQVVEEHRRKKEMRFVGGVDCLCRPSHDKERGSGLQRAAR